MLYIIASIIVSTSVIYSSFSYFYYEKKLIDLDNIKSDLKKDLKINSDKLYQICNELEKLLLKNNFNNDARQILSIRRKNDIFYDNI
jgi:hypothetical protein